MELVRRKQTCIREERVRVRERERESKNRCNKLPYAACNNTAPRQPTQYTNGGCSGQTDIPTDDTVNLPRDSDERQFHRKQKMQLERE